MTEEKRPNDLTDEDINKVLIAYQDYFKRRLNKVLPNTYNLPFKFTKDDFLQEILIKMWQTIKYKYNPKVRNLNTFIVSHINWTIQYVISTVTKSLSYTGKDVNDNKLRRTQIREIQKNLISLDKYSKMANSKFNSAIYDDNDFTDNDRIDRFLYSNGISSQYNEELIQWTLDFPIVLDEIENRLSDDEFTVFVQIFLEGNNQACVSELINQSQGAISKSIIKIRKKIRIILRDLGYSEINYTDKA